MKLLLIKGSLKATITLEVRIRLPPVPFYWHSQWYLLVHYRHSFKYNWELW